MSNIVTKIRNWSIGLGLTAIVACAGDSYFISDTVRTHIIDTGVKRYGDKEIYLVYTDAGVFKNTDALFRGKTKSSDMQGELMKLKGKEVDIEKYGWRIGILSAYENVVGVKEVPSDNKP
jgi:hypothetical protein